MLTAVQPEKLSDTLGAVSQALSGRGEQLGDTLVLLNQYVEGLNPSLPDLQANLRALAPTADIYNQASPDLILALDNLVTTSRTLVEQRAAFESTFRSVTSASDVTTDFLAANRENIIELAATSRPILELLARYSSEFPCLFQQLTDLTPKINDGAAARHRHPDRRRDHDRQRQVRARRGAPLPRHPRAALLPDRGPGAAVPAGRPDQGRLDPARPSRSTQDAYAGGEGGEIDEESADR